MKTRILLAVLTFFALASSVAEAQSLEKCQVNVELPEAIFLPEVRNEASLFIAYFCEQPESKDLPIRFSDFVYRIGGWFYDFGGFEGDISPERYSLAVADHDEEIFAAAINLNPADNLQIDDREFVPASAEKCSTQAGAECGAVLEEFVLFYSAALTALNYVRREGVILEIEELLVYWGPFLDRMRGQTWLENVVNGWLYRRTEGVDFTKPPSSQLILLHPMFLVEYVESADDGEQLNEALAVELLGINWPDRKRWYLPSGGSFLAAYSDRDNVSDWAFGGAVHFNSVYTIGYTYRDGHSGVFLSVDLVKLFQNRGNVVSRYTGIQLPN